MDIDFVRLLQACVAMVISLSLHELAHARTALAFGDPTAKLMGRISLNPLRHLDPIGSLAFILTSLAGAGCGWAKPVMVNRANLNPQRLGDIMVSLAGPMANLGLAAVCAMLIRILPHLPGLHVQLESPIVEFLWLMVIWNIMLMLFNLIPLYPLDGHHIQREILPARLQGHYMNWQLAFGRHVLLGLLFVPALLSNVAKVHVPNPLSLLFEYVGKPIAYFLVFP
jgi:Zn-dependent protease